MVIHFFVFGVSALASVTQNVLCFLMMTYLPQKWQHIAVFVTSAFILSLAQLHKQFFNPGVNGLDVPMNLMFNFCKVTSLVCAVSDGLKIKKEGRDNADLKKREKEFAIETGIPDFFDYWAYMYFVGAAISGPWYEFKDF
jgi:D-alanyl-lipoteichoic acid acyltransferase DltB (MBOAT superfamily)